MIDIGNYQKMVMITSMKETKIVTEKRGLPTETSPINNTIRIFWWMNGGIKTLALNQLYNMDCMEGMKQFPDKYFELAIVDPPYGSANNDEWDDKRRDRFGGWFNKYKIERTGGTWSKKYQETNNIKHWDIAPTQEYFDELFRISKNQIIWGGNYFELPPTRCFVIWKKLTISEKFSMAMCEYAWCSFNLNAKIFECVPQDPLRFHPTQKPIPLYKWLLTNYAHKGDKILDTHVGSASSLIACYEMGFEYIAFEIDKDYFDKAQERLQAVKAQVRLF
jgi:site-specific DNA-methyltransferase (adenine-specific)